MPDPNSTGAVPRKILTEDEIRARVERSFGRKIVTVVWARWFPSPTRHQKFTFFARVRRSP